MVNVLILGANGQLARNTARFFLARKDARLTLYLRRARRLENPDPRRVRIVEGDVLDPRTLEDGAMEVDDADQLLFQGLAHVGVVDLDLEPLLDVLDFQVPPLHGAFVEGVQQRDAPVAEAGQVRDVLVVRLHWRAGGAG